MKKIIIITLFIMSALTSMAGLDIKYHWSPTINGKKVDNQLNFYHVIYATEEDPVTIGISIAPGQIKAKDLSVSVFQKLRYPIYYPDGDSFSKIDKILWYDSMRDSRPKVDIQTAEYSTIFQYYQKGIDGFGTIEVINPYYMPEATTLFMLTTGAGFLFLKGG